MLPSPSDLCPVSCRLTPRLSAAAAARSAGEYDAAAELEDDRGPLLREIMQLLHSLRLSEAELYEQASRH